MPDRKVAVHTEQMTNSKRFLQGDCYFVEELSPLLREHKSYLFVKLISTTCTCSAPPSHAVGSAKDL